MAFTHLHVHSEYSLLDGSAKIKELVQTAKEQGFTSLAITDHGVMYGVIEFYRACKKAGIKPILGCEVYVAPKSRLDREPGMSDERYHHLILLAENDLGYHNLMKIVSQGFKDGFYYRPRVDKDILRTYHEGLICSSACLAGEVQRYLGKNMYPEAKKTALQYLDIFGEGNYFLELQDHGYPEQKSVNAGLLRLHEDTGIPLIATNDVHYIHAEDWEAHDVLLCIQTQKKVNDEDRLRYTGGQFYLKTEAEMRALFPYAQEALDNTQKIADRCNVEIRFGERKLPKYAVPEGYTASEYLRKLCNEGFALRYPEGDPD
ncbi:MAG: PHP domain-containing protein, partial [Lachnospiraceae bacterium]|nr:PHP domain-containing protein [Lachnospiraceae bacterium]